MAAVLHRFIHNEDAFEALGLTLPTTEAEVFTAHDKIKADGSDFPSAMGTRDLGLAATIGYNNIGPDLGKGEDGHKALITGTQRLTDDAWVAPLCQLAKWAPYLGDGFEAPSDPDSQNLFTLGRAAIHPAGSWEISGFNAQAGFRIGAFPPLVAAAGDPSPLSGQGLLCLCRFDQHHLELGTAVRPGVAPRHAFHFDAEGQRLRHP